MAHYSIGSCYLMRQSPGSERVGGLEVRVRPRRGERGQVEVLSTDWRTGQPLEQSMTEIAETALEGIKGFAEERGIALDDFDITLQRFLWHPIDSGQMTIYRQAGRSAFRSALEGLCLQELK